MHKDNNNPILIAPTGSILPSNHQLNVIVNDDLCSAIIQADLQDVPFMTITTAQLQALITFPDVFRRTFIVVEFLDGGKYDVLWTSLTTGLEKVSSLMLSKTASELRDDPALGANSSGKFDELFQKASAKTKMTPLSRKDKKFFDMEDRDAVDDDYQMGDD